MARKIVKPKRPRKGNRRDLGRFVYYQTKSGNWRGRIADRSAPAFDVKKPPKTYLSVKLKWRTTNKKGRNIAAKTPQLFIDVHGGIPLIEKPKKKRVSKPSDKKALIAFRNILNKVMHSVWTLQILKTIKPRLGRKRVKSGAPEQEWGSIQGWRTNAAFHSSKPYNGTWFDLQDAMREAGDSPEMIAAFTGRRVALHIEHLVDGKDSAWASPKLSVNFNTTITQAETQFGEWASQYVIAQKGEDPSSHIKQIRLLIE